MGQSRSRNTGNDKMEKSQGALRSRHKRGVIDRCASRTFKPASHTFDPREAKRRPSFSLARNRLSDKVNR